MSFTAHLDRSAELKQLRRYGNAEIDRILKESAKLGANAAAKVLRAAAPIGKSQRPSQYYRRNGLGHGTFRKSVKAAIIRGRGSMIAGLQGRTIGYVIGPMGSKGFTRNWIEHGTRRGMPANPWVERESTAALSVAQRASESVLEAYIRG